VDSAEPSSKGILLRLRQLFVDAQILLTPRFCQRQDFVDARILSMTPGFCRRRYFVNANILSTPLISVVAGILSAPIFCRRQCFAGANILSPAMFCQRQYFVAANIFDCV
jgi:hypothetical protein